MLSWVVTFLIIALVAGLLGFGGIAGASIEIAKVIFFIAIVLFLISAVIGLARGRGNVYQRGSLTSYSGQRAFGALIRNLARLKKIPGSPASQAPRNDE